MIIFSMRGNDYTYPKRTLFNERPADPREEDAEGFEDDQFVWNGFWPMCHLKDRGACRCEIPAQLYSTWVKAVRQATHCRLLLR